LEREAAMDIEPSIRAKKSYELGI